MQMSASTSGLLALAALTCALAFLSLAPVGSVSADGYNPAPNKPWAPWWERKANRLATGGRNAEVEEPASVEPLEEQEEEPSFEDEQEPEFNPSEDLPELEKQHEDDYETDFDLPQDVSHLDTVLDTVPEHVEAASSHIEQAAPIEQAPAVAPVEQVAEKLDAASAHVELPTQVTPVEGHAQQ